MNTEAIIINFVHTLTEGCLQRIINSAWAKFCELLQQIVRYLFSFETSANSSLNIKPAALLESIQNVKSPGDPIGLLSVYIAIFSIITLTLIAIIVYLWTNLIRQNKRFVLLEEEKINSKILHDTEILDLKDREIGIRIIEIEKRNRLIEKMKIRLLRGIEKSQDKNPPLINNLIKDLDSFSEGDMWKNLETVFNESHPTFIRDLNRRYPELTANELKVCALIRTNITSKDISEISKLSVKSIEAIRTKLRKKFDLSASEMFLSDFLKQF